MKTYHLLTSTILLSLTMFIGLTTANAHTTELTASTLTNCDSLTKFARNLNHNDSQMSDVQTQEYANARVKCQVQHQDQHLQSEKYFVKKYGSDRDIDAATILEQYVPH